MANSEQVILFNIGNEKFGVRITRVHEIIRMKEITQLPDSSEFLVGIINLRGNIISVIDLRKRFGMQEVTETEDTRIIVVEFNGQDVGLIVDAVSEVLHIDDDKIDDPPKTMVGIKDDYLKGIVKVEEDIIILLDLDNLLQSEEKIELEKQE